MQDDGAINLDDVSKTAFCIPYNPGEDSDDLAPPKRVLAKSLFQERDLEDGQELRFAAYRKAWKKCLDRVQTIVQELESQSVKQVVHEVRTSYISPLPGLPYPEIPVVSVINPGLGPSFLENITAQLEESSAMNSDGDVESSVIHLYPGDVPNLTTGMRTIISNFLAKGGTPDPVKRKPMAPLASYDIKYLDAWYRAWANAQGKSPNLVIVLHEFEQFDPPVMQDIFHICSGHISRLPIVFLLSMTSPSSNYLNAAYSRFTMSLLRVRNFTTPSGVRILHTILLKTFFDPEFEPDIIIGPATLQYLNDYFTRYHSSVDAILTILQLAHLKHFSSDPLTILVHSTPSVATLSRPNSSLFLQAVSARTKPSREEEDVNMDAQSLSQRAIDQVDKIRTEFYSRHRNLRVGFAVVLRMQTFLRSYYYKGLDWSADLENGNGLCDAMLDALRGSFMRDVKHLGMITKKLKRDELRRLLETLYGFFHELPSNVRSGEQEPRMHLVEMQSRLSADSNSTISVASRFSDWVTEYLGNKLVPLEECTLWDVWYTGQSPFPSELLNPSLRASIIAGLLRPYEFVENLDNHVDANSATKSIWELPDTSILFKRYLDSGKMINVYDWFESFKIVLDTQRSHLKDAANTDNATSPRKRGKGKAKQAQHETIDEEKWAVEVQARFVRAMHELDFLGFIKHTGRKADHLIRTVFEIDDAE
ncbi:hypothetical protein M413DRAFT_445512 [Hebeloma cylindrosporum]|uniref:Uncharacterized protein n=1 Tax=Hebeloma cylindrosporum TaxID=76867 RepID=A0A0C3CBD6_HEBCY|nr:hypothetical protein M413DRAFT_445512 [Hebeloma cylindrosporum h7]